MTKFLERRGARRVPEKDIIVLYHADCSDGFGAAWAAFCHFKKKAEYIPVRHQVPPPELSGKEVYTLDFTYPADVTDELVRNNKRVTAIDHHISVKDTTLRTFQPSYALDNSGSVLAWKYFHPNEPVPTLLKYVEDQDLHRFALPDTQPISSWLDLYDFDFSVWTKLARSLERPAGMRRSVKQGMVVNQYNEKLVQRVISKLAYPAVFEGYKTLVVNNEILHSDIANALVAKHPPIGIVWRQNPTGIYVSLRSDGSVDVAQIAVRYGGGGHKAAAGFLLPSGSPLPWHESPKQHE